MASIDRVKLFGLEYEVGTINLGQDTFLNLLIKAYEGDVKRTIARGRATDQTFDDFFLFPSKAVYGLEGNEIGWEFTCIAGNRHFSVSLSLNLGGYSYTETKLLESKWADRLGDDNGWFTYESLVDILNDLGGDIAGSGLTSISWSSLRNKALNFLLTPGKQYRITDYVTTTSQADTRSAGHQFDIIVTADTTNKLNENARACLHWGDTHFANSKLETWKLKYCLDNDNERFAWAEVELTNRVITYSYESEILLYLVDEVEIGGTYYYVWQSLDEQYAAGTLTDFPAPGDPAVQLGYEDGWVIWATGEEVISVIEPREGGKGVIYQMIDEFDNDVPYDFKNIQFKKAGVWHHTFADDLVGDSHNNKINVYFYGNKVALNAITFGNYCRYNTFGHDCADNTFGHNCADNTFGGDCRYNSFGNSCSRNAFGPGCYSNTVGDNCYYNVIGNDCRGNTIANSFYLNILGGQFQGNTIADRFYKNVVGVECRNNNFAVDFFLNSLGNNFYGNDIGGYSEGNTVGNGFQQNSTGGEFRDNHIGNEFYGNTITSTFRSNRVGNGFRSNTVGSENFGNGFGNNVQYNVFGNYFRSNTIGNQVMYIKITYNGTIASVIKYLNIGSGIFGVSSANRLELVDPAIIHKGYQVTFSKDAAGNHIMKWHNTLLTYTGKYKTSNTDAVWQDITPVETYE